MLNCFYPAKEEEGQNSGKADQSTDSHRVWRSECVCFWLWPDSSGTLFPVHPQSLQSLGHQSRWMVG